MNAFIFAFQSDKAIDEYLNTEEPIPDDNDFIPDIHPSSVPVDSHTHQLLNASYENDQKNIIEAPQEEIKDNLPLNGEILPVNEDSTKRRSFINKLFGPMEAGSIRGSIFNLVILSLGSGCLSLPKYIGETSLGVALLLVVAIGLLVWWGLNLISKACYKHQIFIYSNLVKKLYGKYLAIFYEINVILYCIGVLILYQVIIYKLVGEAIYNLFYYDKFTDDEDFIKNSFWAAWYIKDVFPYAIGLLIIFPLCLIEDVSKLRIFSLFGVITLLSIIGLLIFECPSYVRYYYNNIYKESDSTTHLNFFDIKKGFGSTLSFFQFSSSLFYSFITTIGAVPIFKSMKNNVLRRMQKVVRRTVLFDIILFSTISVIGYLTWPISTPSLIIERKKIVKSADIAVSVGRIALVLTIIMKLPSNYNSLRLTLFNIFWGTTTITKKKNIFVTLIVLVLCCTVSILYSEISGYIKLIGGICSAIVGFLIPSLLYTRTNKYAKWHWKNIITQGVFLAFTLIGFISAGRTIYEIITGH